MAQRKKAPKRGRPKGGKNMRRNERGNWVNQYGVEFTPQERRDLENAVRRAMRLRKKQLETVGDMPRFTGGKPTGDTVSSLQAFGKEGDFIIRPRTASMQRFRSKRDFNRYLKQTQGINLDGYVDKKARDYKSNYMRALRDTFGADADPLIKKIRYMRVDKYRQIVETDEDAEIGYIYDASDLQGKLEKLNRIFGVEE